MLLQVTLPAPTVWAVRAPALIRCGNKFRSFLVDEHGFTGLSAAHKAWAARIFFWSKARREGASLFATCQVVRGWPHAKLYMDAPPKQVHSVIAFGIDASQHEGADKNSEVGRRQVTGRTRAPSGF